jgi:hypothetical protein
VKRSQVLKRLLKPEKPKPVQAEAGSNLAERANAGGPDHQRQRLSQAHEEQKAPAGSGDREMHTPRKSNGSAPSQLTPDMKHMGLGSGQKRTHDQFNASHDGGQAREQSEASSKRFHGGGGFI